MNKGLKALKKASPEAYAKIMGMDKKELGKMADKGLKILKQYFSGGVVPHAVFTPIGMQTQQRQGMQNFVNAAANLPTPAKKDGKGKKEPMEELTKVEPEIIAQNVEPKTIMGGGSGMGMKQAEDLMIKDIPMPMAMDGMKVMKDGGMYAKDGKKMPKELLEYFKSKKAEYGMKVMGEGGKYYFHGGVHSGDDEVPELSAQDALAILAAQNPGMEVRGSTADTARSLPGGLGSTTAISSTATPIAGFVDPRPDETPPPPPPPPPIVVRPEGISPMRPLKAGLPQEREPRDIMGEVREIQTPQGPTRVFSFSPIGGYGMTPESGNVAGSGSSGANFDESKRYIPGGLHATVSDSRNKSGYNALNLRLDDFYLPGATGIRDFDTSPFGVRTLPSGRQEVNMGASALDNAGKLNITDIYDIYGEDAYMSALGALGEAGVDIDQFDLPVFFDRPSRYGAQGSSKSLGETYTPTQADILKSRASRSVDGRVVSGTGRLGDPALMGGTGKRAKQGTDAVARSGRELLDFFARQAQFAKERYGPNSPEAREAEDLIAQNLGAGGRLYMQGGKMYGMGGMRPIKNYGHGGKNC